MKALFLVLNKVEKLNLLLNEFANENFNGATIFNSNGMAHSLYESDDHNAFFAYRSYINPKRKESKTIMMIINDDEQQRVVDCIEKVLGDLSQPDLGIIFTFPIDYVKGIHK